MFGMLLIEDNILLSPNKPTKKILYWDNPFCSPHYQNKSPFPLDMFSPFLPQNWGIFHLFYTRSPLLGIQLSLDDVAPVFLHVILHLAYPIHQNWGNSIPHVYLS